MNVSIEEIAARCGKARRTRNGWQCCCPAHEDSKPSLDLCEADDTILYNCKAGCSQESVRAAIEALGFALNGTKFARIPETAIHYTYEKQPGVPYHRVVKLLPSKKMWLERYEKGKWVAGLNRQEKILYHLPELRAAVAAGQRVAIAEGEKDADRITKESGICCTTNMAGAALWEPQYSAEFTNADVTIFYDNDEPGRERRDRLVEALTPCVKKLTVINLPAAYKDISEFWDADQELTAAMYQRIAVPSLADEAYSAADWILQPPAETDPIVEGVFEAGDKVTIIGKAKMRKSFFALQMALSLACGRDFLGLAVPAQRRVLLVQYEIKKSNFHKRLLRMCHALRIFPGELADRLSIINARGKNLDDAKIVAFAEQQRFEVIVFDPLYKMMEGDESDPEMLKAALKRLDIIAEGCGAAVVIVHHDKKGSVADIDRSDRGSGSGLLGRDLDASFMLAAHEQDELTALEFLLRNNAPRPGVSVRWDMDYFAASDAPVQVKTPRSAAKARSVVKVDQWAAPALQHLSATAIPVGVYLQKLEDEFAVSERKARAIMDTIVLEGRAVFESQKAERGMPSKFIKLA